MSILPAIAKILFVDDQPELLEIHSGFLRDNGYEVDTAANGSMAAELLSTTAYDLVITDVIMPEKEGIEIIMELRDSHPGLPVIAISDGGRRGALEYLPMARAMGAKATLKKPFTPPRCSRK